MILNIVKAPNPTLKMVSKEVVGVDDETIDLIDNMLETMASEKALGLAAIQVGVPKRIFVLFNGVIYINPVINKTGPAKKVIEGCLSYPSLFINLERPSTVTLTHINYDGKEITSDLSGELAQGALHEMEHLNGKSFLDNLSPMLMAIQKGKYLKSLKKISYKRVKKSI